MYQQTYQGSWGNPYLQNSAGVGQYTPIQQYQQPVNGIVKVNGRDSAMQYQLPPNSTSPALFDNSGTCFYIVSTDGTGMKTVEVFDFSLHKDEQLVSIDGAKFVSREEFDEFTAKVNAALGAINGVHAAVSRAVPAAGTANGAESQDGPAPLDAAR